MHELATEERMWASLWLKKESHAELLRWGLHNGALHPRDYVGGYEERDPARVPTCPFVTPVSLRFEANVIFRHSLWFSNPPLRFPMTIEIFGGASRDIGT